MQFIGRKRRPLRLTGDRNEQLYQHVLQFYTIPPIGNISLKEFEDFAIERLQLLCVIERVGLKHMKSSEDYRLALINELKKKKLDKNIKRNVEIEDMTNTLYDERQKDHISHFILRLAYCRTEQQRRWFINQEVDLFKFRLNNETTDSIKNFLKLNNLDYQPIDSDEKNKIISFLLDSSSLKLDSIQKMDYFKVHFTEVLDLVQCRKTYLRKGYAYIPSIDLTTIIVNLFRMKLSQALASMARSLPELEEDGRLLNMLKNLAQQYLESDYNTSKTQNSDSITPDMIDKLADTSFPLCMKNLHKNLRQNHHLRHGGRMQYGLFLKAIGLNLENALSFWRKEFTKIMDSDRFDKNYAYNIRHNYGKEGKRTNYTPYSCTKIITSNQPGAGDCHGCPFKHADISVLTEKLQSSSINQQNVQEIKDLVSKGHYQSACTRYFEFIHKTSVDQIISHPNQYFEESQKILKGHVVKEETTKITTIKSQVFANDEDEQWNTEDNFPSNQEMEEILKSFS
ncbi:DNA primase large subunit-like [Centruroides vittatus]|uniref:DNA primase large subunit-like n=1 Tax=Centruroides vittatus TaxID=120091 RepID=UPI00350FEF20